MTLKKILVSLFAISLAGCGQSSSTKAPATPADTITKAGVPASSVAAASEDDDQQEIVAAKDWLEKSISLFFQDKTTMEKICTKQYNSFKNDGWSMSEGDMSEKKFKSKWGAIYNLNLFCSDCGFLIDGQDYGKIKAEATLKSKTNDGYWFSVLIKDLDFKANYKRDIRVVNSGNSFLIDEILEYL